jgi:hypothetical protein
LDSIKRYRSEDGTYHIKAFFEGSRVRWSREEGDRLVDETVYSIQDFENMISAEGWTEDKDQD